MSHSNIDFARCFIEENLPVLSCKYSPENSCWQYEIENLGGYFMLSEFEVIGKSQDQLEKNLRLRIGRAKQSIEIKKNEIEMEKYRKPSYDLKTNKVFT